MIGWNQFLSSLKSSMKKFSVAFYNFLKKSLIITIVCGPGDEDRASRADFQQKIIYY